MWCQSSNRSACDILLANCNEHMPAANSRTQVPPPLRHLCTLCDDQVQAECKVVCLNKLCVAAVSYPCSYVYVSGVFEVSEVVSDGVRVSEDI